MVEKGEQSDQEMNEEPKPQLTAEEAKNRGNEEFKAKNYSQAIDFYS